jgi:predicted CoA-substrate-specific enzyme activase
MKDRTGDGGVTLRSGQGGLAVLYAGLDMGNLTTKVVILKDNGVLSQAMINSVEDGESRARKAMDMALEGTGSSSGDIAYVVATGAGRKMMSLAQKQRAPSSCLARGISRLLPSVRTLIDVGAETCTVVRVNERGVADESIGNERCASGTGVFLETMAKLMQMSLEEMANASLLAQGKAEITNMCVIFAEQEVISHIHRDPPTPKNDIIAGIHASMATQVGGLAKRAGLKGDVAVTGGVARNVGFVHALEQNLGMALVVPDRPELVAALGAACIAGEEASRSA